MCVVMYILVYVILSRLISHTGLQNKTGDGNKTRADKSLKILYKDDIYIYLLYIIIQLYFQLCSDPYTDCRLSYHSLVTILNTCA